MASPSKTSCHQVFYSRNSRNLYCSIMFVLLDTTVLGFGNFEFTKFDFSIPQASLTFGVTFPFFDFSGKHETAAEFKNQVIAGRGNFKILVKSTFHLNLKNFHLFLSFDSFQMSMLKSLLLCKLFQSKLNRTMSQM